MDPLIGTVFDERYKILELLERAEWGVVYKAQQLMMDRTVAIKLLAIKETDNKEALARFQQEARALAALSHPNIASLYDFGVTHEGQPFLVMEYLPGKNLSDLFKQEGPLDWRRSVRIFAQVCDGLDHAHKQGVIHRDLNPGNIQSSEATDDKVKVRDFGVAKLLADNETASQKLTITCTMLGDPLYMSPEQCRGAPLEAASDIYSLGCIIYESLAGKPPFQAPDLLLKHCTVKPVHLHEACAQNMPPALSEIVARTLEKVPAQRYPSMAALKSALLSTQAGEAIVGAAQHARKSNRSKAIALAGAIVCLLSLIPVGNWFANTIDGRIAVCRWTLRWQSLWGGWDDIRTLAKLAGLYAEKGDYTESINTYKQLIGLTESKFGRAGWLRSSMSGLSGTVLSLQRARRSSWGMLSGPSRDSTQTRRSNDTCAGC